MYQQVNRTENGSDQPKFTYSLESTAENTLTLSALALKSIREQYKTVITRMNKHPSIQECHVCLSVKCILKQKGMQHITGKNCAKHIDNCLICSENCIHTYGDKPISTWHLVHSSEISHILIVFSNLHGKFTKNRTIT